MPRALIAGCGYLGQAVAELFAAERWGIEGWTMSAESAHRLATRGHCVIAVDISKIDQVRSHVGNFDVVIHCASTRGGDVDLYRRVYLEGAGNLLKCFPDSRILFISSTSVYAQTNGEWVTEESAAEPQHETGKILREAERLVLPARGVVARLGGIYGPSRSALLRKFLESRAVIDPDDGRFVNQIHRDDAAAALQLLIKSPATAGEVYNVVDDQPILLNECYRWLSAKLNRPVPLTGKSTSNRKRGQSNKRVSNAKLKSIGWSPKYPTFAVGMETSVLPALAHDTSDG
jgi:nucleoside-diphosphate-sugar epimerase